jgi:hypothetical protein
MHHRDAASESVTKNVVIIIITEQEDCRGWKSRSLSQSCHLQSHCVEETGANFLNNTKTSLLHE